MVGIEVEVEVDIGVGVEVGFSARVRVMVSSHLLSLRSVSWRELLSASRSGPDELLPEQPTSRKSSAPAPPPPFLRCDAGRGNPQPGFVSPVCVNAVHINPPQLYVSERLCFLHIPIHSQTFPYIPIHSQTFIQHHTIP